VGKYWGFVNKYIQSLQAKIPVNRVEAKKKSGTNPKVDTAF